MKYKILFSIPVHEKLEVILDQISNILTLNDECCIILHLSPVFNYKDSKISLDDFKHKLLMLKQGNVILNPTSVRTGFFDIIQAHICNYRYAATVIDFEYIAFLASNELFIKHGLYNHIKEFDCGVNDAIIPATSITGTGKSSHKDQDLRNMLNDINAKEIYWSQIEGSYYKKNIFSNICDVIDKFYDYRAIGKDKFYAREEVYFPSVFWGLYKNNKTIKVALKGMFTFVPWGRKGLSPHLTEVMSKLDNVPNVYCIKRVARLMNDPVRTYIRQKYGYVSMFDLEPYASTHSTLCLKFLDYYRRIRQNYFDRIKIKFN